MTRKSVTFAPPTKFSELAILGSDSTGGVFRNVISLSPVPSSVSSGNPALAMISGILRWLQFIVVVVSKVELFRRNIRSPEILTFDELLH